MMMMIMITVAGVEMTIPRDLAQAAGWCVYSDGAAREERSGAAKVVMRAMSEGLTGVPAFLRAVAIFEADRQENARISRAAADADAAIHAARIRRQAAMLECRARGVSCEIEDR